MIVTIHPGALRGCVAAPPSKSHVHRLLIAGALAREETRIYCPGENEDIAATARCLARLGARVTRTEDAFVIAGPPAAGGAAALDCGESGTTLRFLLPLCAALDQDITLTGRGRLPKRPNAPLLSALRSHGARIEGELLPLTVKGGLRSGAYALPGDVSSQYFSGLLLALPLLAGDSALQSTSPLESMPYVALTLAVLRQFGVRAEETEGGWQVPGGQSYRSPGDAAAEGDWSAAAFWRGANHLGGAVRVTGLDAASCQGDKAIDQWLSRIGGVIDVSQTPDLMPILAAVAAAIPGAVTRITGASRLRLKESDRLAAMADAIRALGGEAEEETDGLLIRGAALRGGVIDGQNDHRVVMSAAIAATACQGPVTILGAEAVNKSYPRFWKDFEALGGLIHG